MNTFDNIKISPEASALLYNSEYLIQNDQVEQALELIGSSTARDSVPMRNARGVCLLRLGRLDEALAVFRDLYFPNNAVAAPHDTPTEIRVNYISALLMLGNVQVAASLLYSIPEQKHPAVKRLRAGIRAWKRALPWWGRILQPVGLYPESPPRLGRNIGRFWFPPTRQAQASRQQVA